MADRSWLWGLALPVVASAAALGAVAILRRRRGMGETHHSSCPYCGHEIACDRLTNIHNSSEAFTQIIAKLGKGRKAKQESVWVAVLNARNQLLRLHEVSKGSVNTAAVHPREVFAPAIKDRAAAIFLVHNHPSGDVTPSPEDAALTDRIVSAGYLMGIPVLDHLVVAKVGYYSFRDNGRIKGSGC